MIHLSNEQVVNQYVDSINYKLDIYLNLIESIVTNGTIQNVFANQNNIKFEDTIETSRVISKEIDTLIVLKKASEVNNIILYANDEEFPSDGSHISNVRFIKNEEWYNKMLQEKGQYYSFHYVTSGLKSNIVSFVIPIIDISNSDAKLSDNLGWAKIDMYADRLFYNTQIKGTDHDIFILDVRGNLVFGNHLNKDEETRDIDSKKAVVFRKKLNKHNWDVEYIFYHDAMAQKIKEIWIFMSASALISIVMLMIFMTGFSKLFSQRLRLLIKKIKKVEMGNFEISEVIGGKDEIGIIDKNFNRMTDEVKRLISENYIQKLEKREAELNALQVQINPHFLYNTLESINSIASVYQCQEICKISQKLGDMFRYSINIGRSEFTTLEKEIEHIQNYIYIQKVRFGERFDVYYDVPNELLQATTLKFILQPIVENSLYHGFVVLKEKGVMEVSARLEEDRLILEVRDNGSGMTAEQVENLNKSIHSNAQMTGNSKRSIGMRNVNARIKLAFGEEYGLVIQSKPNAGTKVTILLPQG